MADRIETGLAVHTPIIISTVVVVLTIIGGFWSLADPRTELKAIRDNYLTIREHQEFQNRVTRDIQRLEAENQVQASKTELNAVVTERRAELDKLHKDVEELLRLFHEHERDDRLRERDERLNGKPKL